MKHPGLWLVIMGGKSARFVFHDAHGFHTFRTRASHRAGFAARVAAELNEAAARHLFARLVLAGPARTLEAIEEALDPAVRRGIMGRVVRALVAVPDQDLALQFPAWPLVR